MNRITIVKHVNLNKTFTQDVPNLAKEGIEGPITSVKVVGKPWNLYEHANYEGKILTLEEGVHSMRESKDYVCSLKLAMNTIRVYEQADFQGHHKIFTQDVPNLVDESFKDSISSAKVDGGPWLLYEDANYEGHILPLEEGAYSTIKMNGSVSSLKLINEDLRNPQITLYEEANEGGHKMTLTQETSLLPGYMHDKVSCHRVQSGVWLLYEHINKEGRIIVARAGEYLADYKDIDFDDKVSHVYPLHGGNSSVST